MRCFYVASQDQRAHVAVAGVTLTGSCHPRRTGERSPLASERPFPSAARRGGGAGRPLGTLQKHKGLVREGCGPDSRNGDAVPSAQTLFGLLFLASPPTAFPPAILQLFAVFQA